MTPCEFQVYNGKTLVDCGQPAEFFYKMEAPSLAHRPYDMYCRCTHHNIHVVDTTGHWVAALISEEDFVLLQVMDS